MGTVDSDIAALTPANDTQRDLKSVALQLSLQMGMERWILVEGHNSGFIDLFYVWMLAIWILVVFTGFGLFAPTNPTVMIALALGAFSVACAVGLILKLDRPFSGFVTISAKH